MDDEIAHKPMAEMTDGAVGALYRWLQAHSTAPASYFLPLWLDEAERSATSTLSGEPVSLEIGRATSRTGITRTTQLDADCFRWCLPRHG